MKNYYSYDFTPVLLVLNLRNQQREFIFEVMKVESCDFKLEYIQVVTIDRGLAVTGLPAPESVTRNL